MNALVEKPSSRAWKVRSRIPQRMRNLTRAGRGVSDLLNYQAMVGDGVVMLKDEQGGLTGPLLAGFWLEGVDFESALPEEIEKLVCLVNQALKLPDGGWMLHAESVRVVVFRYERGAFVEPVDRQMDEEREAYAATYETRCALFVTQPASRLEDHKWMRRARAAFLGEKREEVVDTLGEHLARFEKVVEELAQGLGAAVTLRRMRHTDDNDELLQALQLVVNGEHKRCRLPANPVHLDVLLARDLIVGDEELVHGAQSVAIVGLFELPASSTPGLLRALSSLDVELRWSSRFILMDYRESRSQMFSLRRTWAQKMTPVLSQVLNTPGPVDRDAVERTDEVDEALGDLEGKHVRFGHYTSVVIVRGESREQARARAKVVVRALTELGFEARLETRNDQEALLGSFPGHGVQNVRKPLINTLNFADLLPLWREWEGSPESPNPWLAPGSPCLLQARSWSGGVFYLNLHAGDVGHTLVLGPIGAGKSTLLATLVWSFMRYRRAQVFVFDKGFSMLPLTLARSSGAHYALGAADGPSLCPLADIDSESERTWAAEWLETLLEMGGQALSPAQRMELFEGVRELAASSTEPSERTLTHFLPHVQDRELRETLRYYSSGVGSRVLNGECNAVAYAALTTFELEELMEEGASARERVLVPTLLYLFHQIEKRLDGRPSLLVIDEAWTQLSHPRFAAKLQEWLKTLRKKNCAVVMATQSLSDVTNSLIADAVFESCMTRILLPNPAAATEGLSALYRDRLQLSEAQVQMLANAERKRWYMFLQERKSRMFTLDLGPVQLAFVGASSMEDRARVTELYARHGAHWPWAWLRERGQDVAASRFLDLVGGGHA